MAAAALDMLAEPGFAAAEVEADEGASSAQCLIMVQCKRTFSACGLMTKSRKALGSGMQH